MARAIDLMGLGMPHMLASRLGDDVYLVTCAGQTALGATQIGPTQSAVVVNASNSGSGVRLPPIGGDLPGCLLGDDFTITNILSGNIYVYAANNSAGSAVTLYGNAASVVGTTGVSIVSGWQGYFQAITVSTWVYNKGSA